MFSDPRPPEHTFKVFSAQGIGKAIALRLADDGFDVAVNDIPKNSDNLLEVVKEIKAKGRASSAHLADVSVEDEVKAMVADVVQVYHALDVVRPIVDIECKWFTGHPRRRWSQMLGCASGSSLLTVGVHESRHRIVLTFRSECPLMNGTGLWLSIVEGLFCVTNMLECKW